MQQFQSHMPGTATPEILTRYDESLYIDWRNFASNDYKQLLEIICENVNENWPTKCGLPQIIDLFAMHYNAQFVQSSIATITANNFKTKLIHTSHILEAIVAQETILASSFIDLSHINDIENHDDYIQHLISIPNKMANELKQNTPYCFQPKCYAQTLLLHILKAIHFMANVNAEQEVACFNGQFLTKLLSRIIVNFNEYLQILNNFITVLAQWSKEEKYKIVINDITTNLDKQAIEIFAIICFKNNHNLLMIIDRAVTASHDWKYCLLTKIPTLLSFAEDNVAINLITYLSTLDQEKHLLMELMEIWSNKSCLQDSSIQQHTYITKLIILIVYSSVPSAFDLFKIRKYLFKGVQNHIESISASMRCIGMITAELILAHLDSSGEKLEFDYNGFSVEDLKLLNSLKSLTSAKTHSEHVVNVDNIIESMMGLPNEHHNIKPIATLPVTSTTNAKDLTQTMKDKLKAADLDSDDELEPYDLSNDVTILETKAPKYLQDLIDSLLEQNDADLFLASMKVAQQLIETQLPAEDISVGLELLQIFLKLDLKFHMDNFQAVRLGACVAICCIIPKEAVKILCKEFHSDVGQLSIADKILHLEILSCAAKELSLIKPATKQAVAMSTVNSQFPPKKLLKLSDSNEAKKNAEKIIRRRIHEKTKRFATKTQHPFKCAQRNRFADLAGDFFFPLLYGYDKHHLTMSSMNSARIQHDTNNVLLVTFLHTLATIVMASQNLPIISKMAKEVFQINPALRFNPEPRIRVAVLQLLASVFLAVPQTILNEEMYNEVYEVMLWLETLCEPHILKAERNEECREIAAHVLALCAHTLKNN